MTRKEHFLPGNHYHVFNHAIAFENLFRDNDNYTYFVSRMHHHLAEHLDINAWCLMNDQFHLMVYIKKQKEDPEIIHRKVLQSFSNFLNGYAKAINKRYNRRGRLFASTLNRIWVRSEDYYRKILKLSEIKADHFGMSEHISNDKLFPFLTYYS